MNQLQCTLCPPNSRSLLKPGINCKYEISTNESCDVFGNGNVVSLLPEHTKLLFVLRENVKELQVWY